MALSQDTASTNNEELPLQVRYDILQKEFERLKTFNEICLQTLSRQGDWKKHYQELSKDNRELRKELERWQRRTSPMELSLRHAWARPTVYRKNLVQCFTEKELGEYLWYQLEIIEPGLRFCGEQVLCGNGFIDLAAEDRCSKHVLIELKVVEDDSRLLGQVARYTKAYSERYGVCLDDVRMIVIAPSYGNLYHNELITRGVTLYKYEYKSSGLAIIKV